jgi:heterodisulfide reductase subunit A-like polyferredoxin
MTSSEFERILSASGPTMGHLVRMSDHKEPKRIAWLQCIGSRDTNRCGNEYCSSVCCMYAIKEAMIAKDHAGGDLETVIFNMDIRTFGKDYEKYYLRAKEKSGVRFVKARIHTIDVIPETDNLVLDTWMKPAISVTRNSTWWSSPWACRCRNPPWKRPNASMSTSTSTVSPIPVPSRR